MSGPKRPLSAAELASLEHAFAADPGSDAYRPLTEAYLAAGRFMEAMVVCKKGVKAHPDDPGAKVLLARVYADQGKDRKAIEELAAVLAAFPNFASANLLAGTLHFRLGATAEGAAALQRAAEASPHDPEVLAALAKHGVPSEAAAPVAAPVAAPAPGPRAAAPSVAPVAPRAPRAAASAEKPTPTPPPVKKKGADLSAELFDKYATQAYNLSAVGQQKKKKMTKTMIIVTAVLFVVLALSLGGWAIYSKAHKEEVEAIDKLLKETQELIAKDSFGGYKTAAEKCREIVKMEAGTLSAHAFLAYVDALRAGEHAEGEEVRKEAMAQVDAARKLGRHSSLIAAEAYLRASAGDAPAAITSLKSLMEGDPNAQVPLLMGTLGVLLMNTGELDQAKEWLAKAQKANPSDVRIAQQLGEQFRRRGEGYELQADNIYQLALRLQKDHVPSLLGRGLVLLDRGHFEQAAAVVQQVLAGGEASARQQALAHAIRGSVLFAQGKKDEGAADEKKALELDAASPDLPWLIGRRQLRDGDAAAAVASIQRAVNGDARRVAFYVDLTRALLATEGGAKKAIDLLQKASTRTGDHPRIALLLGDAYKSAGDLDRARGQYDRSIQLGKPFPDARVALAKLHRDQGNVPAALAELDLAIAEYGQGSPGGAGLAYVDMAEIERGRGAKPAKLQELYEKALAKDPANCDALWGARKLEAYVKGCPRAPHAAEAERLLRK